jgi:hypothetical protein
MGNRGTTPSWEDDHIAKYGLFGPAGLFESVRRDGIRRKVAHKKARRRNIKAAIKEEPPRRKGGK